MCNVMSSKYYLCLIMALSGTSPWGSVAGCCWGSCHSRAPQQLNPYNFCNNSVFANWLLAAIPKIEERYRDECPAMNGARNSDMLKLDMGPSPLKPRGSTRYFLSLGNHLVTFSSLIKLRRPSAWMIVLIRSCLYLPLRPSSKRADLPSGKLPSDSAGLFRCWNLVVLLKVKHNLNQMGLFCEH